MKVDSSPAGAAPPSRYQTALRVLTSLPEPLPADSRAADAAAPQLDVALEAVNRFLAPVATSLRFVKDESSGRVIVRVIDAETQAVLRQMPSEDVLIMNRALDRLQGLIVQIKV